MSTPYKHCPLCGGGAEMLHPKVEDYFFGSQGQWDLYQCTAIDCGVAFPFPYLSDAELSNAYGHYYTHGTSNNWFLNTIKIGVARQAYSLAPSTTLRNVPLLGRLIEEARLSTGSIPPQVDGIIGDIGSGSGDRLELLRRLGWKAAVGVDPDPTAVLAAKRLGRQVTKGSAEHLPWENQSLDAALLHHVIEHVRDPNVALKEVFRVLKPGGRMALITPNIASVTHKRHGRHWRGLEAPRHLTIFTLNALVKTVVDSGFSIECARSSARSGFWNTSQSQYAQSGNAPKGPLRRQILADAMFRQQSASIASGEEIGDELLIIAIRPTNDTFHVAR